MSRDRWGNGATPPPVEVLDGQLALDELEQYDEPCPIGGDDSPCVLPAGHGGRCLR